MNREYNRKAPLIRFALLAAALCMTLSVGGFIDLIASSHVADAGHSQLAGAAVLASR
jgi:hypothetical protein